MIYDQVSNSIVKVSVIPRAFYDDPNYAKPTPKNGTFGVVVLDEKEQNLMNRKEFFDLIVNKSNTHLPDGSEKMKNQCHKNFEFKGYVSFGEI